MIETADKKLKEGKEDTNKSEKEIEKLKEGGLEDQMLAQSFLIRCLNPETVQSMEATVRTGDPVELWNALINKCQLQHYHIIREVHQQFIIINMLSNESVVEYQGRAQKLGKSLDGIDYGVPDAHRWGIITSGLLDV